MKKQHQKSMPYNDLAQAIKELKVIDSQTEEPNRYNSDQSGHNQSDNKNLMEQIQAKPTTKPCIKKCKN